MMITRTPKQVPSHSRSAKTGRVLFVGFATDWALGTVNSVFSRVMQLDYETADFTGQDIVALVKQRGDYDAVILSRGVAELLERGAFGLDTAIWFHHGRVLWELVES